MVIAGKPRDYLVVTFDRLKPHMETRRILALADGRRRGQPSVGYPGTPRCPSSLCRGPMTLMRPLAVGMDPWLIPALVLVAGERRCCTPVMSWKIRMEEMDIDHVYRATTPWDPLLLSIVRRTRELEPHLETTLWTQCEP